MSITEFPTELAEPEVADFDGERVIDHNWPPFDWPDQPIRVVPPAPAELFKLRVLIIAATIAELSGSALMSCTKLRSILS